MMYIMKSIRRLFFIILYTWNAGLCVRSEQIQDSNLAVSGQTPQERFFCSAQYENLGDGHSRPPCVLQTISSSKYEYNEDYHAITCKNPSVTELEQCLAFYERHNCQKNVTLDLDEVSFPLQRRMFNVLASRLIILTIKKIPLEYLCVPEGEHVFVDLVNLEILDVQLLNKDYDTAMHMGSGCFFGLHRLLTLFLEHIPVTAVFNPSPFQLLTNLQCIGIAQSAFNYSCDSGFGVLSEWLRNRYRKVWAFGESSSNYYMDPLSTLVYFCKVDAVCNLDNYEQKYLDEPLLMEVCPHLPPPTTPTTVTFEGATSQVTVNRTLPAESMATTTPGKVGAGPENQTRSAEETIRITTPIVVQSQHIDHEHLLMVWDDACSYLISTHDQVLLGKACHRAMVLQDF